MSIIVFSLQNRFKSENWGPVENRNDSIITTNNDDLWVHHDQSSDLSWNLQVQNLLEFDFRVVKFEFVRIVVVLLGD